MSLKTTSVSRCLEKKLMLFGFEAMDLLIIFLILSVLNLVFGQTALKIPLVWVPSIALAIILRVGKRGKPDNFLMHWLRFQFKPGTYSAFLEPTHTKRLSEIRRTS